MDHFLGEDALLVKSELYTKEEIKNIITMRNQLQSKIQMKDKNFLIKYINSEKKIFNRIEKNYRKDHELYKQSMLRILHGYSFGLSWFKDDLSIWMTYIKFCTQVGDVDKVTKAFPLMLQLHKESHLWFLAAQWELSQFNNIDKALGLLYRGIHHNPKAKELYIQILKLELSVPQIDEETKLKIEEKSLTLFDLAKKSINELHLYIEFLQMCSEYKFVNKLQLEISLYMIKNFYKDEQAWYFITQRELTGYHVTNIENFNNTEDPETTFKFEIVENRQQQIENCLSVFQIALKTISTDKMWEHYLNILVDLHEKEDDRVYIQETFIAVCQTAHKRGYMNELHYIVWLDCLEDSPNYSTILKEITDKQPEYIKIWNKRIDCHMCDFDMVEQIFNEAVQALGDNAIAMWRRKIQYYQLTSDNASVVGKVYEDALEFSSKVSLELQAPYLEWVALFRGCDKVFEVYKRLAEKKPFCLNLHKKMIEIESVDIEPKKDVFNYINAVIKKNPEHEGEWKDYIFKEANYGPPWRRPIFEKYFIDPM